MEFGLLKGLKKFILDWELFKKTSREEFLHTRRSISENSNLTKMNRVVQTNLSTMNMHQKTFPQFKNKHNGQDIVILASGPSSASYKPIENAIHIGVNRSFQVHKNVLLDYVFIQDYSGKTKEYIDELDQYEPDHCVKFYGLTNEWVYDLNRTIPESHAIKAHALRFRTDWADLPYFIPQFAYDISCMPLGCFGSVVFPALQFALWTNPKRIYLVGCDCSTAGYANRPNETNFLIVDSIAAAYKQFKEFAYKYYPETEIISINPVNLKGLFKDEFR